MMKLTKERVHQFIGIILVIFHYHNCRQAIGYVVRSVLGFHDAVFAEKEYVMCWCCSSFIQHLLTFTVTAKSCDIFCHNVAFMKHRVRVATS